MPDDLPDGHGLDDLTLDELVQLRDRAHARAERLDALAGKLDVLIIEHEDKRADREADRRRAAFRIITGGALLAALGWIVRRLGHLAPVHPAMAAGAALGAATLAAAAALAVVQLDDGGRGGGHGVLSQSPAMSDHPTPRTRQQRPGWSAAPSRTSSAGPGEVTRMPGDSTLSSPPSSPTGSHAGGADTDGSATPTPSVSGTDPDPGQGAPSEPPAMQPTKLPFVPTVEPSVPTRAECVPGVDLEPLLGLCLLGQT